MPSLEQYLFISSSKFNYYKFINSTRRFNTAETDIS